MESIHAHESPPFNIDFNFVFLYLDAHSVYDVNAIAIILLLFVLAGTGALGVILDNVPETLYAVCTAQEHAFQSIFDAAHIIIDDPKARETLELLNQGQQISRPSMDYLDKILKKKGFAVQEIVCKITSSDLPTENTESVDCETLNGADDTDGFSLGDAGWAEKCYEYKCESMSGADNTPGLTSNDTGWAKECYNLRNHTST